MAESIENVAKKLKRLGGKGRGSVQRASKRVVGVAGERAKKGARKRVNSRTQQLARSIGTEIKIISRGVEASVFAMAPYARRIELGGGGIRAQGFLENGVKEGTKRVDRELADGVMKEILRG